MMNMLMDIVVTPVDALAELWWIPALMLLSVVGIISMIIHFIKKNK